MKMHIVCICVSMLVLNVAAACSYSPKGTCETLSASDIQLILDAHNEEKSMTPVPTYEVELYTWSADLQRNAEVLGRSCVFKHSDSKCRENIGGYGNVGENLAVGSSPSYDGQTGLKNLIKSWIDEKKGYNWGNGACSGVCGHYTQVVWGESKQVGCAWVKCPASTGILGSFNARYLVCQYGPTGNWQGVIPQKKAPSQSAAFSRPCGVGGVCSGKGDAACTCKCINGFSLSGNTCVKGTAGTPPPPPPATGGTTPPPNPCASVNCGVNGACNVVNGAAKCSCSNGYTGTTCQTPPSPCTPNPCSGGAACTVKGNSYTCAATTTPPPPPATLPAQPPIVAAVFKKVAALSGGRFSKQDFSLQEVALTEAKKCGPTGSSSMSIMLCNFDAITDASQVDMYAQMIVDMLGGYNKFWNVATKVGVVMDTAKTCGACDLGQNRALTFTWNSPQSDILTSTNHPLDWGLLREGQPDVLQITHRDHTKTVFIAGGGVFVVAALVAGLIVYRRRQQAVDEDGYSAMEMETTL